MEELDIDYYLKKVDSIRSATHISHFIEKMTAYHMSDELIARYMEDILGALRMAEETGLPQVVEGESDYSLIIRRGGHVSWCHQIGQYNLLDEDHLPEPSMLSRDVKVMLTGKTARGHRKVSPLFSSVSETKEMIRDWTREGVESIVMWKCTVDGKEEIHPSFMDEIIAENTTTLPEDELQTIIKAVEDLLD